MAGDGSAGAGAGGALRGRFGGGAELGDSGWTRAEVLQALETIAWAAKIEFDDLLSMMYREARERLKDAEKQWQALVSQVRWDQRKRMILDGPNVQKICRYETHLERALYKALHELQRLQAVREGRPAPMPAALDVTVTGMAAGAEASVPTAKSAV